MTDPKRLPSDGMIEVGYTSEGTHVEISAEGDGFMCVSEFNARRILGALSLILRLPLTKSAQKAIRM